MCYLYYQGKTQVLKKCWSCRVVVEWRERMNVPGLCNPADAGSFPSQRPAIPGTSAVSAPPFPPMLNGTIRFLGRHEGWWDYLVKYLTGGWAHSSHSPNVSSLAFAESSSWIVCKPLRRAGQNCSQEELLNNTVYLYSGKIEIVMLWLAGAIYRPYFQRAVGIRALPNKFTNSLVWP